MGLTSLQACLDTSDWLQGTATEEAGIDSSSSPSAEMLTCSRPLMERRLRPQHDQALKCPRCDSTYTKFCYYNNYSLSQPRYFCKTCRRYWTKGGTLRNIPVGGGCRKNKKSYSSKKSSSTSSVDRQSPAVNQSPLTLSSSLSPVDLQLSFPEDQLSQLASLVGANGSLGYTIDFIEGKFNGLANNIGATRCHEFAENGTNFGIVGGIGDLGHHGIVNNVTGLCAPFGFSLEGNNSSPFFMDNFQRFMLPHDGNVQQVQSAPIDIKPNTRLLSLEWQDHGCSAASTDYQKDSFGHNVSGLASWSGTITNGYESSGMNPVV
ncbi:hypothetical protein Droror1_Dr00012372 [Drosera rotundifolia]